MKTQTQLETEFRVFHADNPHVYRLLCQSCAELITAGVKRYGVAPIIENMRYRHTIETKGAAPFKLPNNHRAYYARLWLRKHPQHSKFFRTARLRSKGNGRQDRYGRPIEDLGHEDFDFG